MELSLNRGLLKREHVDHIDDNKTNDDLNNLQILTPKENSYKASKGVAFVWLKCDYCGRVFSRKSGNNPFKKGYKRAFCNKTCMARAFSSKVEQSAHN